MTACTIEAHLPLLFSLIVTYRFWAGKGRRGKSADFEGKDMNYYIFHVDSYMYIVSPRIRPILYFQKKCMRGTPPSKQGQEVGYEDFK